MPEEELVSVANVDDAMRLLAKIPQQEREVLVRPGRRAPVGLSG